MPSFLDTLPEFRTTAPTLPVYDFLVALCSMQVRLTERLDALCDRLEQRERDAETWQRKQAWETGRLEQRRAITAARLAGDEPAWFRAEQALMESHQDEQQVDAWIAQREAQGPPRLRVVS